MNFKKIGNLLVALLFALFAFFQWNDPDSLPWILLYLSVAALFFAAFLGKRLTAVTLILGGIMLLGMLFYLPGAFEFLTNDDGIAFSQGMQNDYPYIEEAREFGGLTIAFLAVLGLWLSWRKSSGEAGG